jgi:hypothetical protein
MAYSILINGTISKPIKNGYTIKEILSEELDNVVLSVPQTDEINGIEPYDIVAIYKDTTLINKMLLGDYTCSIASFNPEKWNYYISLVSPTQKLKTVVLPNLAITQHLTGDKTTLLDFFNKIKTVYLDSEEDTYYFSDELVALITNEICPEETFNKSNVLELFNFLLDKVGCVCKVEIDSDNHFKIGYLDKNAKGRALSLNEFIEADKSYSMAEYVSELDNEVENALYPLNSDTDTFARCIVKTSPRALNNYQLTDDNAQIVLPYPIYRLEKVEIEFTYTSTSQTLEYAKLDITSKVLEKNEYDTLHFNPVDDETIYDTKTGHLYYKQGSRSIDGLGVKSSTAFGGIYAINNILNETLLIQSLHQDFKRMLFTVTYVTLGGARIRTSKETNLKHDVVMFNSQSNSYVDLKNLGLKEIETINRLGNERMNVKGRYPITMVNIPKITDYYQDYVVTQVEKQYTNDYILLKAELSKNFASRHGFDGIDYRKRITQLATEETLERHDLIKKYCMFSFISGGSSLTYANYILKTLDSANTYEGVQALTFKTDVMSDYASNGFLKYAIGNSIVFSFKCEDNISVGNKIYDTTNYLQDRVKYVDENGEFTNISIKLYKNWSAFATNQITSSADMTTYYSQVSKFYPIIKPIMLNEEPMILRVVNKTLYKDNREITKITLQDEFLTNDKRIIIGNHFIEKNNLLTNASITRPTLYLYYSTYETYKKGDKCKGEQSALTITFNDNSFTVNTLSNWASWSIGDADRNMYIGVNGNQNTIYLNILDHRG